MKNNNRFLLCILAVVCTFTISAVLPITTVAYSDSDVNIVGINQNDDNPVDDKDIIPDEPITPDAPSDEDAEDENQDDTPITPITPVAPIVPDNNQNQNEQNNNYQNYSNNQYNETQNYNSSTSSSTKSISGNYNSVELISGTDDIDSTELNANDWKVSLKGVSNDSGDFNFIKEGTTSADNSWWLYLGITLIVLSISGVTYVVLSSLPRNNKNSAVSSYANQGTRSKTSNSSQHKNNTNSTTNRNTNQSINSTKSNPSFEDIYSSNKPNSRDNSDWDDFFSGK